MLFFKQLIFITIVLSAVVTSGYCQVSVSKTGKNYLIGSKEEVDSLNEWAFLELDINPEKAGQYIKRALSLADSLGYKSGKASALTRFGSLYMLDGDYAKADSFFLVALLLRLEIGNKLEIAGIYNNIGLVNSYAGNDDKAVKYYKDGLNALGDQQLSNKAAMLYNNLGDSHMYLGNYEEAVRCINQGISIRDKLGDEPGLANSLLNLGSWYFQIGFYDKALTVLDSSLALFQQQGNEKKQAKCLISLGNTKYKLGHPKMALEYFDKALLSEPLLEKEDIASAYRSKGVIYRSKNLPGEALSAFTKSLGIFTEIGNVLGVASLQYNLGVLHKEKAAYPIAISHFQICQSILDTINEPLLYMNMAQEMSDTYARLGQTELAFQYSLKHNELQDSLDQGYRVAMNYKVEYEEEQKKNAILEKEKQQQLAENNRKNLILKSIAAIGVLAGLLLAAIVWALLNSRRKKEAEQEIDDLLKNQEIQATYAKLEGQDEERKRIAMDLHDRVGSILSTVKLYFSDFDAKLDAFQTENQNQHVKANELLDKAVSEVRRIAQNIHSGTLVKFGLKAELEALSEMLRNSDRIDVEVVTHGIEERLPIALEIKIYRIIQELISNVLKHAQATKVIVQVNQFADVVNVLVQDNGKGFDPEIVKKQAGMGLRNIESRVFDLHGSIIIDSGKQNGTTVAIDIPWEG